MKNARRIILSVLSVILVLMLALSAVACSDPDFGTEVDYTYVTLGQYPTRHLSDRTTINGLKTAIANGLEADPVTGYYTYNNSIYAKATASLYSKPLDDKGKKNSAYYPIYFEDGTMIEEGEEYFFIVEPIKWRVLSGDPRTGDEVLLLSESVLTAMAFNDESVVLSTGGNPIYAGDWAHSDIRAFLNGDFYNKAFKSGEKAFIQDTVVDYGKGSTHADSPYTAEEATCQDKVYLLSYQDLVDKNYKWTNRVLKEDTRKVAKNTDYSKAMGAYSCTNVKEKDDEFDFYDSTHWWLRSTADFADRASVATAPGSIGSAVVTSTFIGVRPAITVKLG